MESIDAWTQEKNQFLESDPSTSADQDFLDTYIAEEVGDIKTYSCEKNPGHEHFIPVTDFKLDHLPEEFRNNEYFKTILLWADLTVKIKVKYVSKDRPETYKDSIAKFPNYKFRGSPRKVSYGSGYIFSVTENEDLHIDESSEVMLSDVDCSCLLCQKSEKTGDIQNWYFTVVTSIHVIFDSDEAGRSIFECFYDSNEAHSVTAKYLYGIKMYQQTERNREKMAFVICVTHDKELAEKLQKLIKQRYDYVVAREKSPSSGPAIMISHPHGCSKTVTVGHVLHLTVPVGDDYAVNKPMLFEEDTECIIPYSLLSKVPVTDFAQEYGIELLESNNYDVTTQGNSNDNKNTNTIDNILNQTDDLTIETSEKFSRQLSDCEVLDLSLPSATTNEDSNHNTKSQDCISNSVYQNFSSDSPTKDSTFDTCQFETKDKQGPLLVLPSDKDCLSHDDHSHSSSIKPSSLEEADNNVPNNDDTLFCFYNVDDTVEKESSISIPEPDHLISLTLPPQMTFTIPEGANFARRYNGVKALFDFPPGTKFNLGSGKEVYLPEETQFYCNRASIQFGYMSYMVDSCPGSSGGCMLLDGGNTFRHTFPHAGCVEDGVSLCGLRCYSILPSAI